MAKPDPSDAYVRAYASVVAGIKKLRVNKGVTQVELAKRLSRTQQFVSYVESGARRIDLVDLVLIVRALEEEPLTVLADFVPAIEQELVS
jgi:transcriptional regulator with XRE-family HTH domain